MSSIVVSSYNSVYITSSSLINRDWWSRDCETILEEEIGVDEGKPRYSHSEV